MSVVLCYQISALTLRFTSFFSFDHQLGGYVFFFLYECKNHFLDPIFADNSMVVFALLKGLYQTLIFIINFSCLCSFLETVVAFHGDCFNELKKGNNLEVFYYRQHYCAWKGPLTTI